MSALYIQCLWKLFGQLFSHRNSSVKLLITNWENQTDTKSPSKRSNWTIFPLKAVSVNLCSPVTVWDWQWVFVGQEDRAAERCVPATEWFNISRGSGCGESCRMSSDKWILAAGVRWAASTLTASVCSVNLQLGPRAKQYWWTVGGNLTKLVFNVRMLSHHSHYCFPVCDPFTATAFLKPF